MRFFDLNDDLEGWSKDHIFDALQTLQWIVDRIDEEATKSLEGKRPNWKGVAHEVIEEAYGALGRLQEIRVGAVDCGTAQED